MKLELIFKYENKQLRYLNKRSNTLYGNLLENPEKVLNVKQCEQRQRLRVKEIEFYFLHGVFPKESPITKELLDYLFDIVNGDFIWKNPRRKEFIGKIAGSKNDKMISINGQTFSHGQLLFIIVDVSPGRS